MPPPTTTALPSRALPTLIGPAPFSPARRACEGRAEERAALGRRESPTGGVLRNRPSGRDAAGLRPFGRRSLLGGSGTTPKAEGRPNDDAMRSSSALP